MPFWGYPDWKANQAYTQGTVVYHKTYLYVAMTYCEAGDDPLTSTFTCNFTPGSFGFGASETFYTYSKTMRKWTIFDLPFYYYHAKLCGLYGEGFSFSGYGSEDIMVLNVYRPEGPDGPDPEDPKLQWNWAGYGTTYGLNSEWPESQKGELVYHISFVPLGGQGPDSVMPEQYGDETVSNIYDQSHLFQYNTTTFFIADTQYGGYGSIDTAKMFTMFYPTFGRTHNFTGDPSGTASINSPSFADNYMDAVPELPETDPPTQWDLTGISPNHPD